MDNIDEIDDLLAESGLIEESRSEKSRDKYGLFNRPLANVKTVGQPKTFATPEDLFNWYVKYMEDIKANPVEIKEFVGKGVPVYKTNYRPPSWKGFEAFLFRSGMCNGLKKYRSNFEGAYTEYVPIVEGIAADMFDVKYSGASMSLWNASIISKELHLAEHIEVKSFERPILENGKELPKD